MSLQSTELRTKRLSSLKRTAPELRTKIDFLKAKLEAANESYNSLENRLGMNNECLVSWRQELEGYEHMARTEPNVSLLKHFMEKKYQADPQQRKAGNCAKQEQIPVLRCRLDEMNEEIKGIVKSQQQIKQDMESTRAEIAGAEDDLKNFDSFNREFQKLDQVLSDRIAAVSSLQKAAQATLNGTDALLARMEQRSPNFNQSDPVDATPKQDRNQAILNVCMASVANNLRSERIVDVMSFVEQGYSPVPGWVSAKMKEVRAKYDTLKA
jgi:chromosome segregation ATPase